jgi:hypothetical protein
VFGSRDAGDDVAEAALDAALAEIEGGLRSDLEHGWDVPPEQRAGELGEDDPALQLLAGVNAWASLISGAVAYTYAPASPWPRRLTGWGQKIAGRLQWLTNLLLRPLAAAGRALGASSWSISLSFPWGVSVGLNWP